MKKIRKFKKGAASFYIVAISTLILVIIAASFAAVIISEIARTSNDDLAQSAYDAALAGVEDAKLAYYNYQKCLENDSCDAIQDWIDDANAGKGDCDMVANMLGRKVEEDEGVLVQETDKAENNMQQYYTCVTIKTERENVVNGLNSNNPAKVVRAKFANGVEAKDIESITVSWQTIESMTSERFSIFNSDGSGIFQNESPMPPVLSVGLIQTGGNEFTLDSFDISEGDNTNRGTLYLVPADRFEDVPGGEDVNYIKTEGNRIEAAEFVKSNDKTVKNKPYVVDCGDREVEMYACSVTIALPKPIGGGNRNDETFAIVLSLPYADSSTEVSLEYNCAVGNSNCKDKNSVEVSGESPEYVVPGAFVEGEPKPPVAVTKDTQITIDSTGRANDLYRRVETILEPEDTAFPYPLYAIQVLGDDSGSLIDKNISPTCEWGIIDNDPNATGPKGLCENT